MFDNGTSLQNRASVPAKSSSVDQPPIAAANPQTYGLHSATPNIGQNVSGGASLHQQDEPRINNPSFGGNYGRGSVSSRNMNIQKLNMVWGGSLSYESHPNSVNQNQRSNSTSVGVLHPPANSYGHPAQTIDRQPPPMDSNKGPLAGNEAPARIIPIAALNPYQGRLTIKAGVTTKGVLRCYNNPRGQGKVFSFNHLDSIV